MASFDVGEPAIGSTVSRSAGAQPARDRGVAAGALSAAPHAASARPGTVVSRSAGRGGFGARSVMALQRAVGNGAVSAMLGATAVQRQSKQVSVGPISLNNTRISVPIPAGATLQATVPQGQSVTWSLVAGTAAVDPGSSIDAAGLVTLAATQAGGRISVRATDSGGSGAFRSREVFLIKAPGSITATAQTGHAPAASYGANFRHTFDAVGGGPGSECEGGRVNELFVGVPSPMSAVHDMTTPFGPFRLVTNDPASTTAGWGIDSGGRMNGDDHVTIGRDGIDIRRFVTNTSNPTPANPLPVSFSVTQTLRSLEEPTNTFRPAFASPAHVRGLRETTLGSPEFFVSANGVEQVDTYTGRPAVRNARAATPTVVASPPPPPPPARGQRPPPPVVPGTVQISADTTPTGAALRFSIQGPALGCSVNARTGLLTIGSQAGTVRVRAAETDGRSFDEVVVTITARPAPTPTTPPGTPGAPGGGGAGGRHTAESEDVPGDQDEELA